MGKSGAVSPTVVACFRAFPRKRLRFAPEPSSRGSSPRRGTSSVADYMGVTELLRLQRCAVFIDGFNLYHGLKASTGRALLWLDLEGLAQDLIKPGQTLVSVTYFTAMVRDEPDALGRQDTYLQALEVACPKLEGIRGKFQRRTVQCHVCQSKRISYEEKETDVSLAVRLVEGAARNNFDIALLLSGDGDFVPAIQAVRRLKPDLRIVTVFPPNGSATPSGKLLTRVSFWVAAESPTTNCPRSSSVREATSPGLHTGNELTQRRLTNDRLRSSLP